ncbi:MAG: zinc carboxypeptidase [Gloeobacteraceae cyanobacterium ES-bin-316]|nr:zinc carboxypeptidase [Ferruginibacter sp.]
MKYIFIFVCLLSATNATIAQPLTDYLPPNISYNPAIPKPRDIIHHEVGEFHVTHDRLVNYMMAIAAAAPDRVKAQTLGFTYENRPQVILTITSKKNHDMLEQIRQQHLLLSDPSKSASVDVENMPIVVYIGHSIHGNEPSGSNAALVSAYHLAAAQGKEIDDLLNNVVILLDPSFNPDGLQRFSTWANQHKSKNLVTDPNSREFNEVWPGGRFNHYWFDLNRDWLPAVHPESKNRVKLYHQWKPNILTDHHEQGSNASFFFQPGVPSRVNPLTPKKNQELTEKLGRFHAKYLDEIGSLYFTKENYDDFYYGKGSTFPDINGAIGILFEQASSRGHAQLTGNGILRFPATIKNQFTTTLSTLEGARQLRKEFLEFQRDFYKQSVSNVSNGFVFGDKNDRAKTFLFIEMMQRHGIAVQEYTGAADAEFEKGSAYTVSLNQPQQVLVKAIFTKQLTFSDSLFYDITSWTMPLAFGIPYKEINGITAGKTLAEMSIPVGEIIGGKSEYAYLFEWDEFYAPRALLELQKAGLITKVATNKTTINTSNGSRKFDYGTILIPVKMQEKSSEVIFTLLKEIAKKNAINVYSMQTGGASTGSDLGSSKYLSLTTPSIAMLVGTGVTALDAGEVWHLLDQRMNIPASHLDAAMFNRADISKYNTILMVSGSYAELNKDKLKTWVQAGGVLILLEEAVSWASQNGIGNVVLKKLKNPEDSLQNLPYVQREQIDGAQQMSGAIFGAEADLTHPLAYGYNQKTISLFKANKVFMEKSKNPYGNPFYYGAAPLQSGYISRENAGVVKNSAAVIVNTLGSGRIINIADNPNMRGFWLGGTKLMMNAIFFGKIIDAASGRTE